MVKEKKVPMIESLGKGKFRITSFTDSLNYDPGTVYADYGYQINIPGGQRLSLIQIDADGVIQISALRIWITRESRCLQPLPASILRTRPIKEGNSAYICFEPPLDLRQVLTGDLKLCMTVETYRSDSRIYVSFGTEFLLSESN